MAILALLLLATPALALHVYAQPSQGNWVVSGSQTVQNESITLNGNLTVEPGGSLTLQNVTLTVESSYDGEYGITVSNGASMYIYNSTINRAKGSSRFSFLDAGVNFVMENSQLSGVGWCLPPNQQFASVDYCVGISPNAGPIVETDNALIRNDTFSYNSVGLILSGNHFDVQGNRFLSNYLSAMGVEQSEFSTFRNNTFLQDPEIPYDDYIVEFNGGQNNSFFDNNVSVNETYIAANPQIGNENWRLDGVKINNSPNNIVAENSITTANVAVVEAQSWGSNVTGNSLVYGEGGVNLVPDDVNSRVVGNTLYATIFRNSGATFGIWADISHNSVIANNTLTANWDPQTGIGGLSYGIYLDHTSNSSVVNNNMTLEKSYTYALLALLASSNDSILSNVISGATFGTVLVGSSDANRLVGNDIFADHSVTILGSSGNTITGNNLRDIAGSLGGPLDSGVNRWSNGSVGNYWSFYAGTDQYGNGYGTAPYMRSAVPPNGIETSSASVLFTITTAPVPILEPISTPTSGSFQTVQLIKDQVVRIDSGTLSGDITIANSTLYLAKDGTVAIGPNGGSITIENSTLIDEGYGFSLACRGGYHCPTSMTIINSTLSGAFLNDINIQNLTIENSKILNAQGDRAISMEDAENVLIINNTVSGELNGIFTYCDPAISNQLLEYGNTISNIIDTGMQVCVSQTPKISVIGNSVEDVLGDGIQLNSNALVQGNTIAGCDGNAIFVGGDNNTIVGNNVINSSVGITTNGSGNRIYHNNFIDNLVQANAGGSNYWTNQGQGNYWSSYKGKDADLDGIGDTPFALTGASDTGPYMQPNGWLTSFYLTISSNLPPSTQFSINGSTFDLGSAGRTSLRLGYKASYTISLPQSLSLGNGSDLIFVRWNDGSTAPIRTIHLSSNSTLAATYSLQAASVTTTSSAVTSASITTVISTPSTTAGSSSSASNGGIPEFPSEALAVTALIFLVMTSYLLVRLRSNTRAPHGRWRF